MPSAKPTSSSAFEPPPALVERVAVWLSERDVITPMLQALTKELPAGRYRRELRDLTSRLEQGAMADDLCRSRETVATLMPLLAMGPTTAESGRRLAGLLGQSVAEDERRRQRRRLMAYPLVVVLLATAVFVFLALVVVPVFAEMFNDFGMQIPLATELIVALSRLIRHHPLGLLVGVLATVGAVGLVWYLIRASLGLGNAVGILTKGSSREVSTMALFVRRLSEGVAAALPLPVAMRLAAETTPSLRLRRVAIQVARELDGGEQPLAQITAARRFPATMIHLVDQAGAGPSNLADRLARLSDALSERVASRFDWSTGIVAQMSVFVVGALVAFVLLSLLLPLVSLIEGLS